MKQIILTLISLICLESCQTQPQTFEAKQCQPVLSFNSSGDINAGDSFCRCRDYHIGKDFIGSNGVVTRYPLRECDQFVGYSIRDNTRLVNFMEYVRAEINESDEIFFKEGGFVHDENQN